MKTNEQIQYNNATKINITKQCMLAHKFTTHKQKNKIETNKNTEES